jgi:hypothetical protein
MVCSNSLFRDDNYLQVVLGIYFIA